MPRLIEHQLEVLFTRDRRGRLVGTRGAEGRPAPRLHLGRSEEGNVWALRRDLDEVSANALARACASEPAWSASGSRHLPAWRERVRELLAPVEFEECGPAYVLPSDAPLDRRARVVTLEEARACAHAFPWLVTEFEWIGPVAVAFDAGRPAAVCHSPRGCTKAAAEAGLETLPAFRGRGLATAAVACWARAVQATGRVALYSTSWGNLASQAVARRLSARLYGEVWQLR